MRWLRRLFTTPHTYRCLAEGCTTQIPWDEPFCAEHNWSNWMRRGTDDLS